MATLNLRVLVDVVGGRELNSLSGNLNNIGRNLTRNVTLPILGVGAAAVALASDAQKADAQLAQAFKTMEAGAFTTIPALEAQAEALANATQFDDEQIKQGQAVMLTFANVTGTAFTRATNVATDLSAALGQDLQSSVVQIGKALNDPIRGLTSLRRVGVQFTEQQEAQIAAMVEVGDTAAAQGVILAELERQFGGVATAIGATDAGKFAQSMEEVGEAGESLGTILLPVVTQISGFLKGLAEGFQALPAPVQGAIATFLAFAAAIGPVLFIGSKLIGGIQLLHAAFLHLPTVMGFVDLAFGKVGAAFKALSALLLANPFIALAAAVIAITALIILNWDKIVEFLRVTWNAIMGGILTLATRLRSAWDTITGAASTAWNGLIGVIKGAINAVIGLINGFIGFVNGIQFSISIPNPFGDDIGFSFAGLNLPTIPYLAEGGIITKPTLAILGESGPEAVIPLTEDMGGTHFHSHIEVRGEDPFIRNEDDLIRTQQRIAFLAGFS